jgi:hypothetical protein
VVGFASAAFGRQKSRSARPMNSIPMFSVELRRHSRGPGIAMIAGAEFAVDAQLDPADRQQIDIGFGLAGFDLFADLELPSPDARRCRHCHGEVDAFMRHGHTPLTTRCVKPRRSQALYLFKIALFSGAATKIKTGERALDLPERAAICV